MSKTPTITVDEWRAKGRELFGDDHMAWRFVCPACGHVASVRDWQDAKAPNGAVAFSCIGRWLPDEPRDAFGKGPGPCNYAGGGLIGLHKLVVINGDHHQPAFEFAESEGPDADD